MRILISLLAIVFMITSCQETLEIPKPRVYPRIILPAPEYTQSQLPYCPFEFSISKNAVAQPGNSLNKENNTHPCWYTIHYPNLHSDIYLSYVPINDRADYDKLVYDTHIIVNQVNKRSEYTEEIRLTNGNDVGGIGFKFKGDAASPFQFYLSDTTNHFLRGAVYFNTRANADSLRPVIDYMMQDVNYAIGTFEWK